MKVLGLELSSPVGSIAFSTEGEELFSARFANDRKHSGAFFENLQSCLERFGNPERVVVGLGPGSYAGTRIALATAHGLAMASGAQLLGVPSFCGMETSAPEYAVIGDARRQSFFFVQVRDRRGVAEPQLFSEADLLGRLEGLSCPIVTTQPLAAVPQAIIAQPSALILTQIADAREWAGRSLEPMYLREPHITYPKVQPFQK